AAFSSLRFFLYSSVDARALPSFPTRRSSDLGESVVLRLLDRGGRPVGLDELGMAPDALETFRRLAERPHGILLATGPTGSGKTRSEEHTSELQSRVDLVCRLLLEKKNKRQQQ